MDRDTLKYAIKLKEKLQDLESILGEVEDCQRRNLPINDIEYFTESGKKAIKLRDLRVNATEEHKEISADILIVMQKYLTKRIKEINKELDEL